MASSCSSMGSAGGMVGKLPLLPSSTASLCFKPRLHSLLLPVWAPPTPSILLPEISLQNTSEAIPVTQTAHGSRCPEGIVHTFKNVILKFPEDLQAFFFFSHSVPGCLNFQVPEPLCQTFHMLFSVPVILSIFAWIKYPRSFLLILQA